MQGRLAGVWSGVAWRVGESKIGVEIAAGGFSERRTAVEVSNRQDRSVGGGGQGRCALSFLPTYISTSTTTHRPSMRSLERGERCIHYGF